jgi:hypothetical protein
MGSRIDELMACDDRHCLTEDDVATEFFSIPYETQD